MSDNFRLSKQAQDMFDLLDSKGIKPSRLTMVGLLAISGHYDSMIEFLERYSDGWRNEEKYPDNQED